MLRKTKLALIGPGDVAQRDYFVRASVHARQHDGQYSRRGCNVLRKESLVEADELVIII